MTDSALTEENPHKRTRDQADDPATSGPEPDVPESEFHAKAAEHEDRELKKVKVEKPDEEQPAEPENLPKTEPTATIEEDSTKDTQLNGNGHVEQVNGNTTEEPNGVKKEELENSEIKAEESNATIALTSAPTAVPVVSSTNGTEKLDTAIVVVPPTTPQLFYSPLKTGLVYDVRMRYHAKIFTSYFEYIDPHPEDPRRIYRIYKRLAEAGLIQDSSLAGTDDIGPLMVKIPTREATAEEILEVHSEAHLKYIQATETMTREQLLEETENGDSIYVNNDSYISAKLSCGGTIEACKAVIEGRVKNSLAIVRPPGHHAEPDTPGGFCLFSNVAVAAKNILKSYPESVRKIVIVDWDIHHGNGTQKAFYNDPRVLYISIHRYENGRFYPGTKAGGADYVGEGPGEGYNINIPWRTPGMHDGDYAYAFNKIVLPAISEFNPDLLIISSGFDAADGDIIGGCHVTPTGYGMMTHMLKSIAKGKVAVILEGGYNLDSISKSALGVAKVLVGETPDDTVSLQPHLDAVEVVDEVLKVHSKYWKSLQYGLPAKSFDDVYDLSTEAGSYRLVNIADPVRAHQLQDLFTRYSFISLPIIPKFASTSNAGSNGISSSNLAPPSATPTPSNSTSSPSSSFTTELPTQLDDIIIASPNIYECSVIIVTIHDPPDIWANINPINGNIEGSSSVILEHPLTQIISKVNSEAESSDTLQKAENIGYIDINIPSYQLPSSTGGASSKATPSAQTPNSSTQSYSSTIFAQEVLLYIWDNYLSYFSQLKKLVFVGFGDSYQAIVHLYGKRSSQDIKDLVKGTVVFVNRSNLKSLVPVMDESMVDWYYQNSVVFTSCLNPCWQGSTGIVGRNGIAAPPETANNVDDSSKRPRRKFGRVLRANSDGLFDIINEKFEEGMDFILDSIEDYSSTDSNN